MESIFIMISIAVIALAFLALVVFGLRNLSRGKHNPFSVGAVVVPFIVFGICALLTGGEMAKSAILTVMIMAVLAIAGLVYSGLRGLTG